MNGTPLNWALDGGRVLAPTDVGGAELRCMGPEKQLSGGLREIDGNSVGLGGWQFLQQGTNQLSPAG